MLISLRNNFFIYVFPNFLAKLVLRVYVFQCPLFHSFRKVVISLQKDYVLNTITKNTFYIRNLKWFLGKFEHIKTDKIQFPFYLLGSFLVE